MVNSHTIIKGIERIYDEDDNATRQNSGYGMEVRELIAVAQVYCMVYVLRRESRVSHVNGVTYLVEQLIGL